MLRFAMIAALASVTLVAVPRHAPAQTSGTSAQTQTRPETRAPQTRSQQSSQTAQAGFDPWHSKGHDLDNIANKLNACELHPPQDMQACIDDAVSHP